jgi:lipopolysaccharide heptosyltransferase II
MQRLSPDLEAVLVVAPNWIGDAVMSTPALANLRRGLPKATIDLLVTRRVAPLFDDHPHIDRLVIRDERQPWRTRLAQVIALRRCEYQMVLLLPNSFRAALDAWLLRSPIRLGYATDGRRWLLTHAVPAVEGQPPHQIDAYLRLVAALGLPIVERVPTLAPTKRAEMQAEHLWAAQDWGRTDRVIGICPGAAFGPAKRWWPERFAALADRLIASGRFRVVFFGSPDEVPLVELIRSQMTREAVSLAGQDTLGSFMALAARCAVVIANDSGSMHMANAVGTRVVALFGPTDPRRTAPSAAPAAVLHRDLACSPCFCITCPYSDHPCMRSIEVDDVYRAVLDILG